jgi:hypothetical protein
MKKIILFISIFLSFVSISYAQPANDLCSGAITIPTDGTCVTGTTVASTDTWSGSPGCQSNSTGGEVWYTYVATTTSVNFNISRLTMGGNIELIFVEATSACTGFTQVGSSFCGSPNISKTFTGLTIGALYYFTISSSASAASDGTFSVCVTEFSPPANDDCSGAIMVTPDGTCVAGTTLGATDYWAGTVGCQSVDGHPDVFYSFVATGTQADFTITNGTMTGNVELLVISGTCAGTLTSEGSSCGASPLNATISGLVAGITYLYTISSSIGSQGTFTTCVTTTNPPVVSGQDCATAALLCSSTSISQGVSNAGVGVQELAGNTCLGGNERQSKWFKFTAGTSGTLGFTITPNNLNEDYDFAMFDVTTGCPTTTTPAIACNYAGDGLSTGNDGCTGISIFGSGTGSQTSIQTNVSCAEDQANPGFQPLAFKNETANNYNPLNVVSGNVYALLVDNYSSTNNGFILTLNGTAISGTGGAALGPDAAFTMAISNCGLRLILLKLSLPPIVLFYGPLAMEQLLLYKIHLHTTMQQPEIIQYL